MIIFWFHDIKAGWRRWVRRWWKTVFRFGGSRILRKWTGDFKKGEFTEKLTEAKKNVRA